MKIRMVDEESNAETWTPSKKRSEVNAWRDYMSPRIDLSKEVDANLNFPKIYLMAECVEQIREYGALQQYSAERHEQAHQTDPNDCWNVANHNLNYLPHVIAFPHRILCCELRELNLQTLAQCREHSTATGKVRTSGPDQAAPLCSQSYVKLELMGPPNHRVGKHPDAIIRDFRALLDDKQDATHRVTIHNAKREFPNHRSLNKALISDDQLHAMEL